MATSPLFGWQEPDDTSLVKDGAAAIRTLGNAIDASMGDLLGGTTGQVLAKASNTNMDFTWVAQDDSNAIQNAIVDAKGDLIAATANDTPARLAVGNNGETLVADSSTATGLKWAKSANFVGCSLFSTSTTSAGNSTYTAVLFNSENFDTDGFHSTSVNTSRITIPAGLSGKYLVNAFGEWDNNASGYRGLNFFLNGTRIRNNYLTPSAIFPTQQFSCVLNLAAGDYIEVYVSQDSGSSRTFYVPSSDGAFEITYLGA